MSNTYCNLLFHAVFSTKDRRSLLRPIELKERLYSYISGIAKQNNFKVVTIGGTDNHVHILLSLKPETSIAKAVQLIKGGSSKWIHDNFPELNIFSWQEGYGVFTVSTSQVEATKEYIINQETHHKKINFQEEYLEFLKRNYVDYNPQYLFNE